MFRKFIITPCLVFAMLVFAMFGGAAPAQAQRLPVNDDYQYTGSMQGPVYNPDTKSYFELRYFWGTWLVANKEAATLYYNNTQGRLAIINRPETHRFIMSRFRLPGATWIGLQYFCRSKQLKWVDGTTPADTAFTAWNSDWARTQVRCSDMNYMPVSYLPQKNYPPTWQASGPHKGFHHYLVEYPTGKE